MGLYYQSDDREPEQLASIAGWADVRAWCPAPCTELRHLLDEGWTDEPRRLVTEIDENPAQDPAVAHTLAALRVGAEAAAEVLSVTDGFTNG